MQAGDLHVRLMADIAQFQRQMAQANSLASQTARQMESSFVGMGTRVAGALAAAFSVASIVAWTRQAIDAADQAGKLAQTIGVATEQVAGLQLAFRQSGLEADKLGPVMSKLAAAIANGNKALDAMNVATRNADGSLRGTREVLADVAQRFAGYADGAGKTALAVALLGEEGAKLVPLLNGGATGLAEMDAKARQLGLTLDDNASRAAARFNDEMDLLRARAQGAVQTLGLQLLPVLNDFVGALNQTLTTSNTLAQNASLVSWAEDAAMSIAVTGEALVGVTKLALTLADALRTVAADIQFLGTVADKTLASPLSGGILNPKNREAIKEALAERNRIVESFNARLADLWNYDGTAMSRNLAERFRQRRATPAGAPTPPATTPGRMQAPVIPGTAAAGPKDPLGDFIGRQLAAQAQRDIDAAARAEQAQLEMFARVALARQAAYDKAEQEADAALQREVEFWATVELRRLEAYDKAEQEAEAAHRSEVALMADRALKAIAAYEALEQAADEAYKTAAEAAQRSADSVRDRLTSLQQEEQALKIVETQNVSLTEAVEMLTIARLHERLASEPNAAAAEALKREIVDREKLLMLMGDRQVRDANRQAAEQAARDWQTITEQIGQSLTDALMNGGQKAGDFLKNLFKTMVLRPVIDAVMRPLQAGIGSALGFTGTAATAGGGANGAMNAATALGGMAAYGSLFGAGATMALTGGTSAALSAAGAAMSAGSVGSGLAIGAGALAPWVIGGMILIQGLSRKLKDTGITGTFGGEAGFAGEQYKFYKGGFLRSDKTVTEALQDDMQAQLSGTFLQMRQSTATMARELGLSADALDTFTKDIKLSTHGLTEEQIQQKLAQEFGALGDEMARLVAGSGATAQSLQQLYQAVMSQREQLETRLLELQGDTAALRERERATIHETNLALFDRVKALEDEQAAVEAAKQALQQLISGLSSQLDAAVSERLSIAQRVVSEREGLEQRLLQLQDNTTALRERELAAMDPLNRAFARFVFAAEDAKSATDALAQRMSALADAGAGIAAFVAELRAGTGTGGSVATLRAAYQATLARAQGGDAAASGEVVGAARAMLDASRAGARTRAEADLMAARVAAELEALPATKSFQERQAEALQTLVEQGAAAAVATADAQAALLKATSEGFAYLDTTADGLLTLDELKTGLAGIATDEQIKALIGRVDTNADGQIDELELLRALTGNVGQNTLATLRENETQVAALRDLVVQTVVNSSKLVSLNASIDILANALKQAEEQNRLAREQEIIRLANLEKANLLNLQGEKEKPSAQQVKTTAESSLSALGAERVSLTNAVNSLLNIWEYGSGEGSHQEVIRRISDTADAVPTNTKIGTEAQRLDWAMAILKAGNESVGAFSSKGLSGWISAKSAFENELNDNDGLGNYQIIDTLISRYQNDLQTAINTINNLEALRKEIISLGGTPTFATGGLHPGGLRLVGEQGPELEVTGPARYWNAADTMSMLGNAGRREEVLVAEIRALRAEVSSLRAEARATAENTGKTKRMWERVTRDGESLRVTDVTPA